MEKALRILRRFIPRNVFLRLQPAYHFLLAFLSALWYGFPARSLKVIGVTGTKGKTTTVALLHEILASSGARVASLSSVRFRIGDNETPNTLKMTMPGRFFMQKFLRDAKRAGCSYAVIEVTSQGIAQFRHRFIRFHAAVMTNMAPEHLEAHGGFEPYLRAKLDLFWRVPKDGFVVINRDDTSWPRFVAASGAHKVRYEKNLIQKNGDQWDVIELVIGDSGIAFECAGQAIVSSLVGEFNFYNILAAMAVGLTEHIALDKIAGAVGRVPGVSGRMEFVAREPFAVVVDYAHTPDSLRSVYSFLRKGRKRGGKSKKLVCVLGATGGGRDIWKRPEFGKIAAEFCDAIIVTNEDPYDEDPGAIADAVITGIPAGAPWEKIMDRGEAIREAIRTARKGDTVAITGKGSESWIMGPAGSKIPWDDLAIAREALDARK